MSDLQNKNPEILIEAYETVINIFKNYGWYIFIGFVFSLYVLSYFQIEDRLAKYFKKKSNMEYDAKYHKDSDLFKNRQIAMDKARLKMQEKMNIELEKYKEKLAEKEEKKRQMIIEKADAILTGKRLGGSKSQLKTDYNPLMGNSGGSNCRPQKRSPCSGGNCGK